MNLVQITPGAGGMFCGGCFRDNALVADLRRAGHSVTMVPLYLPLTLDEPDQSAGMPVFFGGVSVFLEQKSGLFRRAPRWLRRALAAPGLLRWAAGRAAKTRAADVGDLTLSMLRGEEGRQARELDDLVAWLKSQPRPEAICLSNALLAGLARRLRREVGAPVACQLQGEDTFLDALPAGVREAAWKELALRAAEMKLLLAPSRYYAELMERRLRLPAGRVQVVFNGIDLAGYAVPPLAPDPPVLGYFARMCPEKGLGTLVDAYLLLKQRASARTLRLRVGGGCGPADAPFVEQQRARLARAGLLQDAEFLPNVDRAGKIRFLQSLTIFSAPALYGEAFGLYVIEALAAGVPVVQPRHAAFPEIIEATGGGVLCEPGDPKALADAIEKLLLHPLHARHLGRRGREAVEKEFSVGRMAARVIAALDGMRQ